MLNIIWHNFWLVIAIAILRLHKQLPPNHTKSPEKTPHCCFSAHLAGDRAAKKEKEMNAAAISAISDESIGGEKTTEQWRSRCPHSSRETKGTPNDGPPLWGLNTRDTPLQSAFEIHPLPWEFPQESPSTPQASLQGYGGAHLTRIHLTPFPSSGNVMLPSCLCHTSDRRSRNCNPDNKHLKKSAYVIQCKMYNANHFCRKLNLNNMVNAKNGYEEEKQN